jgi:hypothetical protein
MDILDATSWSRSMDVFPPIASLGILEDGSYSSVCATGEAARSTQASLPTGVLKNETTLKIAENMRNSVIIPKIKMLNTMCFPILNLYFIIQGDSNLL